MSADVLTALQMAHAFDPFPVREDLGLYHVPFSELVGSTRIESTLLDACRRFERIAIVGDSGTGKSSLTASVLGPLAEGVAPVLVPVVVEPSDTVTDPGSMFAHIAAVIARFAADAMTISDQQRDEALSRLTAQRPVGRVGAHNLRLGAGWMGASVSADLSRQAGPAQSIGRSASEMLEVVHQMLATIHNDGLTPVLVFDDTDRWLSGSAFADHEALARSFFGRVLAALAELHCALVVAVHRRYLHDATVHAAIARTLETRIEVPTVTNPSAIAAVVGSRVRAHLPSDPPADLNQVMTDTAVTHLFDLYRSGLRGELRGVLRTAHVALADACDVGADVITDRLVDAAFAAWEPA